MVTTRLHIDFTMVLINMYSKHRFSSSPPTLTPDINYHNYAYSYYLIKHITLLYSNPCTHRKLKLAIVDTFAHVININIMRQSKDSVDITHIQAHHINPTQPPIQKFMHVAACGISY